jgi:hypothetical protein
MTASIQACNQCVTGWTGMNAVWKPESASRRVEAAAKNTVKRHIGSLKFARQVANGMILGLKSSRQARRSSGNGNKNGSKSTISISASLQPLQNPAVGRRELLGDEITSES